MEATHCDQDIERLWNTENQCVICLHVPLLTWVLRVCSDSSDSSAFKRFNLQNVRMDKIKRATNSHATNIHVMLLWGLSYDVMALKETWSTKSNSMSSASMCWRHAKLGWSCTLCATILGFSTNYTVDALRLVHCPLIIFPSKIVASTGSYHSGKSSETMCNTTESKSGSGQSSWCKCLFLIILDIIDGTFSVFARSRALARLFGIALMC